MDLSIIIPVYKVEQYIGTCLDSIFSQNVDLSLFEVIIVNDGTPDKSMDIVSSYIDKYYNISVIEQENSGLSVARNNGIKLAKGKYVWCVDSDDWIPENSLNIILSQIKNNCDAIKILLGRFNECDGTYKSDNYNKYLSGRKFVSGKDYIFDQGQYAPAQGFIYKKEFLEEHSLYFYPQIYHEDTEFGLRALYLAKTVLLINDVCYNYRLRSSNSIMSSFKLKNFQDLILIYQNLKYFKCKHVCKKDYDHWDGLITVCVLFVFFIWAKSKSFEKSHSTEFWKLYDDNKDLFNRNLYKVFKVRHFHKRYIKMYLILRFFPKMYFK